MSSGESFVQVSSRGQFVILKEVPQAVIALRMLFDKISQERTPPQVQRKSGLVTDAAILGVGIFTVVALVGIAAASLIFAMSERKQLADLRSRTEDRLASNERDLAAVADGLGQLTAINEAAKPDFAKRLPEMLNRDVRLALQNDDAIVALERIAALTRKARETKASTDAGLMAEVARQVLRLMDSELVLSIEDTNNLRNDRLTGPAMEAVTELVGYRSFLLNSPLGLTEGVTAHNAMLVLPKLHEFSPQDSSSKIYASPRLMGSDMRGLPAKLELMDRTEVIPTEEAKTLIVDGYDLKLDGLDARNVLFTNCKITYSGAPIALDNVYFSNCTFSIERAGKDFAAATLTPSGQTGIIKR